MSEKLDGQNLMISWSDGKLKAETKGHLKMVVKLKPTTKECRLCLQVEVILKTAFVGAMKDLEKQSVLYQTLKRKSIW